MFTEVLCEQNWIQKILLEIKKHLKMPHLFNNAEDVATVTHTQKIQIFEIQNPEKCSAVTETIQVTHCPTSFGAEKCSEN